MDLYRHLNVLWRFRRIVTAGVILGVIVAVLATFQVSLQGGPRLTHRTPEAWTATSKLLVTQAGFPWGRTVLPGAITGTDANLEASGSGGAAPDFADPSRLGYLSLVYSSFLTGDEIRTMLGRLPPGAQIVAAPLRDGVASNADALPIIELNTSATNGRDAVSLNDAATDALRTFLDREQDRSETPREQRVRLDTVAAPAGAVLVDKPGLTVPLAAFLFSVCAAVAFAYTLENLRTKRPPLYPMHNGDSPDDFLTSAASPPMERTRV